jgi:hypothetical protein
LSNGILFFINISSCQQKFVDGLDYFKFDMQTLWANLTVSHCYGFKSLGLKIHPLSRMTQQKIVTGASVNLAKLSRSSVSLRVNKLERLSHVFVKF